MADVDAEDGDFTDEKISAAMASSAYLEEILDDISKQSSYQKKYFTLRRKCEHVQQANEKLINRLYYSKVLCKLYKKERRLLMTCLDDYGDEFREAQVPVMWDEVSPPESPPVVQNGKDINSAADESLSSQATATPSNPTLVKRIKVEKPEREAPRKPVHPFVLFSEHNTKALKDLHHKENKTDLSPHELSRILADKWQHLLPEDKKVYHDLYEEEKRRYDNEMKEYLQWMRSPASSLYCAGLTSTPASSVVLSATPVKVKEEKC